MKAKSKVLLGLLVALAMVVLAVPAFAADFTITASTPKTVYVGATETDPTFTLTVSGTADETFSVTKIEDVTANIEAKLTVDTQNVVLDPTTGKGPTVKMNVPVATTEAGAVGKHTLRLTVSNGTLAQSTDVEVTVAALPTAKLTGYDPAAENEETLIKLEKTVAAGKAIDLHVVDVTPADATPTYQWQISKTTTKPEKDADWTNIDGETADTLNKVADIEMNGKFVRCAVTVNGKTVYAEAAETGVTNDKEKVKLNVSDVKAITVKAYEDSEKTKAAKESYEFYETAKNPLTLTYVAVGGPDGGNYTWTLYKDGNEVKSADYTTYGINFNSGVLTFGEAKEKTAGVYSVTASKGTDPNKVVGESEETTITVKKTPTMTVAATGMEVAKKASYTTDITPDPGEGEVYVTEDQAKSGITLTATPEGGDANVYAWYKAATATGNPIATGASLKIDADDVVEGAQYTVSVGFSDKTFADKPLVFKTTIHIVSGKLEGGLLISKDGLKTDPTRNNEYTITLPAGWNFPVSENEEVTGLAKYGVEITPDLEEAEIAKVEITSVPTKITDATKTSSLKFKYGNFDSDEVDGPIVENMKVVVKGAKKVVGTGETPVTADINLPVSKDNGFQITLAAQGYTEDVGTDNEGQIVLKDNNDGIVEKTYDGEALEAEIIPATAEGKQIEGLGEIDNIRYLNVEDMKDKTAKIPTAADIKKATTEAPADAGAYFVICDIKDGEQWGGNTDQIAGRLQIDALNLTDSKLKLEDFEKIFTVEPASKVYNGKNQKPDVVDFVDTLENVGEIEKVTYQDEKGNEVNPLNVGKYKVLVTTKKAATDTNITDGGTLTEATQIGTFEITKTEPTKDLYTMTPDSVVYDGLVKEPKITAKEGAGAVEDVHYYAEGDDTKEVEPIEAGVYTVKVDVAESDTYAAKKGLEIGTFTIKKSASEQPTIYTVGHVENIGWGSDGKGKLEELKPGGTVDMGTTGRGLRVEAMAFIVPEDYKVIGFAHVENEGDVAVKEVTSSKDYEIPEGYVAYEFGSTGKGQRVEAVCVGLQDASGEYVKGFQYAVHLQNYGWQGFVRNGSFSGTRGMGLRMESVRFTYADPDVVKAGEPK